MAKLNSGTRIYGNVTVDTFVTATGNITGGNINLSGNIVDTGALFLITGSSGNVTLAPNGTNVVVATTTGANITGTLNATGNANVGNLGAVNANLSAMTVTGNANVGNLGGTRAVFTNLVGTLETAAQPNITSVGTLTSLTTSGNISATGNVSGGNLLLSGNIFDSGTSLQINTTSAANISLAPNQTIVLTATTTGANITGTLNATGNANVGNLGTAGLITVTSNVNAGGFSTAGNVTGLYFLGNVACASGIFTTKIFNGTSEANIVSSGGNMAISIGGTANVMVVSTAGANISGTLGATGNITGGNLSGTLLTGTLATAAQPNVTSVGTLTSLSASGNVSGGNLVTTGTVSTGTLTTSGNVTIAGNLTVSGNVISVNVTDLNVVDPIIGLGRGANNTPLTTNDGKDRGEQLWYYTTAEQSAFIGYDNSAGKLIAATNVSVSSEVVTVNNYGNLIVGGLEAATISATGNANVGNLGTAGVIVATGNISGANINLTGNIVDTGALTIITGSSGNVSLAPNGTNVVVATTTGANITGTLNATGNANVGNLGAVNANLTAITATGNANVGNLGTAGQITATGNVTAGEFFTTGNISGGNILGNGFNLSGISAFKTVAVTAGNSVVADSIADTLTFTAGSGITIIASPDTDTITIAAASAGSEIFVDGADFGTVEEIVTLTDDLGLITDALDTQADLGEIVTSGVFYPNQLVFPSYTVAGVPGAAPAGQMIYVSNESGGAVPAFSDGTNWRRVTDRAIIT